MDRQKRVAIAAALVILILFAAVGAFFILSSGAPKEDLSWAPTITPYVDDRVGVMTYEDYYDLDNFCYEVELNDSCQIAVLIVNTTQPYGINDYAIKTFEKNGIGQAGKDNGVLFVFSYSEQAWRVVTGKGVEGILNGAKLTELRITYFDPFIVNGSYSEGIKLYTYAIGLELVDNYVDTGAGQTNYPISWIPLPGWQIGIIVVVLIGLTIVTRGRILLWIPYVIMALLGRGGGGRWGGGGTGGGGARGRF
jgi:uncharacterized protein